jgi:thioredoxin 1
MAADYIQDEAEFDTLLSNTPLLVVDCTAAWCGPCKVIAPLVDQLADAYSEQAKVFKLDLDKNQPVAKRFGVRSIPAIMFFKQGELVDTLIGVKPYEELTQVLERHL